MTSQINIHSHQSLPFLRHPWHLGSFRMLRKPSLSPLRLYSVPQLFPSTLLHRKNTHSHPIAPTKALQASRKKRNQSRVTLMNINMPLRRNLHFINCGFLVKRFEIKEANIIEMIGGPWTMSSVTQWFFFNFYYSMTLSISDLNNGVETLLVKCSRFIN